MHYDQIMDNFGYIDVEWQKLWSSTCFLTSIFAGSVDNDQKADFFAREHNSHVVLFSERAARGAH
jgi:hypothetical protein